MRLTLFFFALALHAQEPCTLSTTHDVMTINHVKGHPPLSLKEPAGAGQLLSKDCYSRLSYPEAQTTIEAFWSDTDLYVFFRCPYKELNLFLPANHSEARMNLWDRDVVEMFVGDDWENIRHYREFEIAPTGDWIDLAIDLNRDSFDHTWRSGWETTARIEEANKIWYAAARIPLKSISEKPVKPGTKWRINFYRIDAPGDDKQRHFMCWQQTCSHQHGNHTPESFGTLIFGR